MPGGSRSILILVDYYLPGWKAGGLIRSVHNLVVALSEDFDYRIVTRDRDHLEAHRYQEVDAGTWVRDIDARVFYGRRRDLRIMGLARLVRESRPDLIYVNSVFSPLTLRLLILRRLGLTRSAPVLVAPRGEFQSSALLQRRNPKRVHLFMARLFGLFRGVSWHASTSCEMNEIRERVGQDSDVFVATDIPAPPQSAPSPGPRKTPGEVRLAFVARISPMKNLSFLLRVLEGISGEIELEIIGPAEEKERLQVEEWLVELPRNVRTHYRGPIHPDGVQEVLRNCHFAVLPTLGESFGHSIFEALRIGRPVLISDRTPWRHLAEAGAGWDLSLESEERWRHVVQECVNLDADEYSELTRGAFGYAESWYQRLDPVSAHDGMFRSLLERRSHWASERRDRG